MVNMLNRFNLKSSSMSWFVLPASFEHLPYFMGLQPSEIFKFFSVGIVFILKLLNLVNPSAAKLFNLNAHPLEADAINNFQVSANSSNLTKWRSIFFQILLINVTFYL